MGDRLGIPGAVDFCFAVKSSIIAVLFVRFGGVLHASGTQYSIYDVGWLYVHLVVGHVFAVICNIVSFQTMMTSLQAAA